MREDYIGGLDRYLHHFPGHLRTTYRLDFLDTNAARIAIRQPAADRGVTVTDAAADELLLRLTTVRVQSPRNGIKEIHGPYVEPVQLQVVCRNLWRVLRRETHGQFTTVGLGDVERHADVGQALRQYHRDTVEEVARSTGVAELAIRDWFETQLITLQRFRSQTLTGPTSANADPAAVALALQDAYLLRSDTRAGSIWYELAHDQLIAPILDDNRSWRSSRLESWQLAARDWHTKHQRELLLRGAQLRYAHRRADFAGATPQEHEFLDESFRAEREQSIIERARYMSLLGLVALLELVVIFGLLALLLWRG
jgi:hypothetical protein